MTGWGDYALGTSTQTFFNAGVRDARMQTYHWMVLPVLRGEVAHQNGAYQKRRRCWPIKPRKVRELTEGDAVSATLTGGGGQDTASNKVASVLDLPRDLASGRHTGSTTESRGGQQDRGKTGATRVYTSPACIKTKNIPIGGNAH